MLQFSLRQTESEVKPWNLTVEANHIPRVGSPSPTLGNRMGNLDIGVQVTTEKGRHGLLVSFLIKIRSLFFLRRGKANYLVRQVLDIGE